MTTLGEILRMPDGDLEQRADPTGPSWIEECEARYQKALEQARNKVLQEVLDFPGPDRLIKRYTKIALEQDCEIGTHKICEMVEGRCTIGGNNCEGD